MKQNKILVLGGYGGNNVGDDAQLEGALQDIKQTIPEASVVVLTPKLEQTMTRHWPSAVAYAPRVSFFDFDENHRRYIDFWEKENRDWLLSRIFFITEEALKYKNGVAHLLSTKQKQAVDQIRTASMVYFAGGGYLMGPTGSRLWDGALVCQVAKIFNTPVVMSGQNIGVWNDKENIALAKSSFDQVKIIGTRDNTFSKEELKKADIEGEHIFDTHDDALYIDKAKDEVRDYILHRIGLRKGQDYITLSFHLESGIEDIVNVIREYTSLPIVIIPTCPPDRGPQSRIFKKLKEKGVDGIYIVSHLHSHAKIKSVIGGAHLCISTRHHPVIFALGCNVPAFSLNYTEYFSQKNYGALNLCNVGKYSFDILNDTHINFVLFKELLVDLLNNRDDISKVIENSHQLIHLNKKKYLSKLRLVWDEQQNLAGD